MNEAYREQEALWRRDFSPEGFGWIDAADSDGNVLAFLRFPGGDGDLEGARSIACLANFSGDPHPDYRIGLPAAGRWREVINTDAAEYGGSGVGNFGEIEAVDTPWHGQPASATLILPPLGVLWLAPET
jgi:1,4-alpha-glucan branching enzyme